MRVLKNIINHRRFGFDIETAAGFRTFGELPGRLKTAFLKKFANIINETEIRAAEVGAYSDISENKVINTIFSPKGRPVADVRTGGGYFPCIREKRQNRG